MRIRVEFVKMSGIRYNPRDVADGHRVRRLPKEATDKWLDVAPEEMAGPLCNIVVCAIDQPVWQCLRYAMFVSCSDL
jgi:hypothetical protein